MLNEVVQEVVDLADEAGQLSMVVLSRESAASRRTTLTHMLMLAHVLRMTRFVQGAVALARTGYYEPVCVLARTVLEMGWVMLSIQDDPDKMDEWAAQASGEAVRAIRRLKLLQEHERSSALTDAHIDAQIAQMPPGKKSDLKYWAAHSGAFGAYPTLYQQLSGCAHAELPATAAYLNSDLASNLPVGLQDADLGVLPADSLNVSTALLHDALRFIAGNTLRPEELLALESMEGRRAELTRRLDACRVST